MQHARNHFHLGARTPAHYRQLANASYELLCALKREHPSIISCLTTHASKKGN